VIVICLQVALMAACRVWLTVCHWPHSHSAGEVTSAFIGIFMSPETRHWKTWSLTLTKTVQHNREGSHCV